MLLHASPHPHKSVQIRSLPPPKKEVMFLVRSVCLFVCLFVCLSVGLLANLWMDFDEIFCRGRAWLKDQVIQFWWRSRSRFGSGSPKSEIRILRIAVFGRGLFSLSASSFSCIRMNSFYNQSCSCIFSALAVLLELEHLGKRLVSSNHLWIPMSNL